MPVDVIRKALLRDGQGNASSPLGVALDALDWRGPTSSQKISGYARKPNDLYETPNWVTETVIPFLPAPPCTIWECAAGGGKMVTSLRAAGFNVLATDLELDFLTRPAPGPFTGIVTNPPYALAVEFIERALGMIPLDGFCAFLLRTDFDHAKSRQHLFAGSDPFARKLVLTRRIRWIEDSTGSPSFNHAWFLWNRAHRGEPTIAYAPVSE